MLLPAWWDQTHSNAAEAAQLGAVWTEASVPQLLHADEAAKHLRDALHGTGERGLKYSTEITTGLNQHHSITVQTETECHTSNTRLVKAHFMNYVGLYICIL